MVGNWRSNLAEKYATLKFDIVVSLHYIRYSAGLPYLGVLLWVLLSSGLLVVGRSCSQSIKL